MGKQAEQRDTEGKAHAKLAKAQLKLQAAEAKYAQTVERGKQAVEQARLRATGWEAKARERVTRRANAVARVEARFTSGNAHKPGDQPDGATPEQPADSPEQAATVIEHAQASARSRRPTAAGAKKAPQGA